MSLDDFLLAAALRATAILVVGCSLALLLSLCRSSAAARHRLWALTLSSSLAVPLIVVLGPAWRVSLPWPGAAPMSSSDDHSRLQPTEPIYLLASAETSRN